MTRTCPKCGKPCQRQAELAIFAELGCDPAWGPQLAADALESASASCGSVAEYHDCLGCDGRGCHPTRDLICQMCNGSGKSPHKQGVCHDCGDPAPHGLYQCKPCHLVTS